MERLIPDRDTPGAFWVRFGLTSQSWVDPARPDFLAFEYVQHIAMVLDHTVLDAPADRRLRVVHLGGAGMSIPRWVAWRRPGTAQVVCKPDAERTRESTLSGSSSRPRSASGDFSTQPCASPPTSTQASPRNSPPVITTRPLHRSPPSAP